MGLKVPTVKFFKYVGDDDDDDVCGCVVVYDCVRLCMIVCDCVPVLDVKNRLYFGLRGIDIVTILEKNCVFISGII